MYGFDSKTEAEARMVERAAKYPQNRYEVGVHGWTEANWHTGAPRVPRTWGVKCYAPYCAAMPMKFQGFVWFEPLPTQPDDTTCPHCGGAL